LLPIIQFEVLVVINGDVIRGCRAVREGYQGSLEAGYSHVPMSQQLSRLFQIHASELILGLRQLQRVH
jgi:hypothetical protein